MLGAVWTTGGVAAATAGMGGELLLAVMPPVELVTAVVI